MLCYDVNYDNVVVLVIDGGFWWFYDSVVVGKVSLILWLWILNIDLMWWIWILKFLLLVGFMFKVVVYEGFFI